MLEFIGFTDKLLQTPGTQHQIPPNATLTLVLTNTQIRALQAIVEHCVSQISQSF
jgi:hypothetical protein